MTTIVRDGSTSSNQEDEGVLSDRQELVLRLLIGLALTMIVACGGETRAAGHSTSASTVGGGSGDATDARNAVANEGEGSRSHALAGLGPAGCYDPTDFSPGAVPNDEIDDRPAGQAAIDAAAAAGGGRVCFGPGRWRLSRAPAGS